MTNEVFNLTLAELRDRRSMKWRTYGDAIPAWVAEMDCRPAPAVTELLTRLIREGDTGYPTIVPDYQRAYADYAADTWGWEFDAERAIIVPDVMQGIVAVLNYFGEPGDAVVVNPPVYPQFYKYLAFAGRTIVEVPMTEAGRLDTAALRSTFAEQRPAAYLLCNPQNPHGTVPSRAELQEVVAAANEYGVRIVSDEIHAPLVSATDAFTPLLDVPGADDAVTVFSASKSWNLAGLKAAVAVGGGNAVERLSAMPDEITHSASYLGILAHVSALREGRDWLTTAVAELDANRRLFVDLLAEKVPQVRYRPGPATYLAWLDCRELGVPDPWRRFLDAGVAFNKGDTFGTGGAGHVRANLATSPEILTEIVDRMARALD